MNPPTAAELHLTYQCDLSCPNCNRGCFIPGPWRPPDMTVKHCESFLSSAQRLNMTFKRIVLVGGEPTLNPDFFQIVDLVRDYGKTVPNFQAILFSNGYGSAAHKAIRWLYWHKIVKVDEETLKPLGSVRIHPIKTIFISPVDVTGKPREKPCEWWPWHGGCGISVDSLGYTACPNGGMIDSVLRLGCRSVGLGDFLHPDFVREQTEELCRHCGAYMPELLDAPGLVELFPGTKMSLTWVRAIQERQHGN